MKKKKILIAMMEVGNGHKAPAIAIKKSFDKLFPSKYDVEVIDLVKKMGSKTLFSTHQIFWIKFALKYPKIHIFLHKTTDNKFFREIEKLLFINNSFKVKKYILDSKPDLIIANHCTCIGIFSMIKSKIKSPVYTLNTDPFDIHYFWVAPNLDKHIVFSKIAEKELVKRGIKNNVIKTFDLTYPLDAKHTLKLLPQKILRNKIGIKNKLTMLIFFGAEGVGNVHEFIASLLKKNLDIQLMIICGRNEKLKKEMEQLSLIAKSKTDIKIFGFVENMQEFISASDVVLGKPGASQTFEVLSKRKPIIYSTYMMNEYPTLKFVIDNGFGWHVNSKEEFVKLVEQIINNPKILKDSSKKIKNISSCSDDIARFINNELK